MRTKDEILTDAGISNRNMLTALKLEVLIDIRDTFQEMRELLGNIHFELQQTNKAIWSMPAGRG